MHCNINAEKNVSFIAYDNNNRFKITIINNLRSRYQVNNETLPDFNPQLPPAKFS